MFTFASRPLLPAFAGRARGRSDRRKRSSSRQNQKSSGGLCARQFAPEPAGLLFPSPSQRIGAAVEFFDVGFIFRLHPKYPKRLRIHLHFTTGSRFRQSAKAAAAQPARPLGARNGAVRALTSGRTSQSAEASRPYSARPFGRRNRAPARIASRIRCPQRP